MAEFSLRIQSPFTSETFPIDWVQINSTTGSFVIGPKHQPLVSTICAESTITYKSGGQERTLTVSANGGLVHVTGEQVLLFL